MKISEIKTEIILSKETALMSKSTILGYEQVLRHLEAFFSADKEVESITLKEVKDYIIEKKSWKRSYLAKHIQMVKAIFKHLEEHSLIKKNIMSRVKNPRNEETPVDFLTTEEIAALDKASSEKVIDTRRRALYWIIRETGLRANEAGAIELRDVNMAKKYIFIRKSKGRITKNVPFSNNTKKKIQEYLAENPPTSIYLFGNEAGGCINRAVVSRLLDDIYDKAFDLRKWKKKRGAHLLRHACATEWVANNGNLKGLQFIMGWNSLAMCDRYVHVSPEIITEMFVEMKENKKARESKK